MHKNGLRNFRVSIGQCHTPRGMTTAVGAEKTWSSSFPFSPILKLTSAPRSPMSRGSEPMK